MTAAEASSHGRDQSAPALSAFPPITEYGFVYNCHGAVVAPDDAVDRPCASRFGSPGIFGPLLDRQAGSSRLGPFGINVPTSLQHEPGTNTLVTTCHTPSGWAGASRIILAERLKEF